MKAQERLQLAHTRKANHEAAFQKEEAKLLEALQKAEPDQQPKPAQPVIADAALLDQVAAMASTAEGRAALAARGLVAAASPVHIEVAATQPGTEEATDREVEALVANLPRNLHGKLAARLVQAGVVESAGSGGVDRTEERGRPAGRSTRDRNSHGQDTEGENHTREGTRSPRRQDDY